VFLAIETSFDDSGLAICDTRGNLTAALLSSQAELHAPYGGCVPELAARIHLSALPQLWRKLPAEVLAQVTHMGVTSGPGLPGCLLAGVNFARGAARALNLPLYGLNHLAGHVFSPFMSPEPDLLPVPLEFPHLALLVSGGHTELFLVESLTKLRLLGQTLDDAVGELLDKVSALLGYGYPGGARMERLAREHPGLTEAAHYTGEFRLPVPMRDSGDLNFSYSGLKTAVVRAARSGNMASAQLIPPEQHPSLLAALFASIAESLWIKVAQAAREYRVELVTVSGGVAINGLLRARFAEEAQAAGLRVLFPPPKYCLDNAGMIAWLLSLYVAAGIAPTPFDADSNWNPGL
jgi:N6-L-threonylcarbamoyladenine synthase